MNLLKINVRKINFEGNCIASYELQGNLIAIFCTHPNIAHLSTEHLDMIRNSVLLDIWSIHSLMINTTLYISYFVTGKVYFSKLWDKTLK